LLNVLNIVAENLLRLQSSVLLVALNSCIYAKFTSIERLISEIKYTWTHSKNKQIGVYQLIKQKNSKVNITFKNKRNTR